MTYRTGVSQFMYCSAACHLAQCRSAKCRYAECRGASFWVWMFQFGKNMTQKSLLRPMSLNFFVGVK